METTIVLIIVAAAFYGAVRHFRKIFSKAGNTRGDCGCGCNGCTAGSAVCHEEENAFFLEKK